MTGLPTLVSQTEELYHVIEGQNETMAKLRDMLHRSQLGQLQVRAGKARNTSGLVLQGS